MSSASAVLNHLSRRGQTQDLAPADAGLESHQSAPRVEAVVEMGTRLVAGSVIEGNGGATEMPGDLELGERLAHLCERRLADHEA